MKKTKHTQGPWDVDYEDIGDHLIEFENPNIDIWFDLPRGRTEFGIEKEEDLANAKLIAAAPEMFALLQEIVEAEAHLESDDYDIEIQSLADQAKELIKKITGG